MLAAAMAAQHGMQQQATCGLVGDFTLFFKTIFNLFRRVP